MSSSAPPRRIIELETELAATKLALQEARDRYAELRHRVGNELQALTLSLKAQARVANQPNLCSQCVLRMHGAVELHRLLDRDAGEIVPLAGYLSNLANTFEQAFEGRIKIETAVDPGVTLQYWGAQCIGLIYVEAATNALKHAFPGGAAGKIDTRFRRMGDRFEMTVSDNGVGFDRASSPRGGEGQTIMGRLTQRLKGDLQWEGSQKGTTVRLTFPASF
jgi:two-component sensor histidine kinase